MLVVKLSDPKFPFDDFFTVKVKLSLIRVHIYNHEIKHYNTPVSDIDGVKDEDGRREKEKKEEIDLTIFFKRNSIDCNFKLCYTFDLYIQTITSRKRKS